MQEHKEWLRFANDDLRTAQILLKSDDVIIGSILYHCQQSVEKSLKAYLAFKRNPIRKTHDLVELLHICGDSDEEFLPFLMDATELNPYATKARYPDNAFMMPQISFAQWAVKQTAAIFEFVQNKLD
ncbi:MAG: HEPN domain-containing protein [Candidatus Babeliales bacterium]|nr:HEPN domain-containing protein [Candidatus Babeliales bacterium]